MKVSASKLLDHWLNDHRDSSSAASDSAVVSDQSPAAAAADVSSVYQHFQTDRLDSSSLISSLKTKAESSESVLHLVMKRPGQVRHIVELVKHVLDTRDLTTDQENNLIIDTPDHHGDTPLTLVRNILEERLYDEGRQVAEMLIAAGADPGHRNECGWSLLSYSLVHQDLSLSLTRALLHHGAVIIPQHVTADNTSSPLRVLLRSILRSQSVDNARESCHILGQVLSCQEQASKMKDHVLQSIVAEASLLTSRAPEICSEIRSILAAYWTQPKPLLHISLQASRKRLGLKRLNSGNLKSVIAPRIHHYLSYQSTLPLFNSQTSQTTGTNKTDNLLSNHQHVLSDRIRVKLQKRLQ